MGRPETGAPRWLPRLRITAASYGIIISCCPTGWPAQFRLLPQGDSPGCSVRTTTAVACGTGEDIMTHPLIKAIDQAALRSDIPDFRPGDSVRVHVRVIEGSRSRVQVFAGVVIARNAGGVQEAFTVRKMSFGVGVERTFPLHSPIIEKIEVERRGDVRRAKLYYLRGLRGKAAKIKEKRA